MSTLLSFPAPRPHRLRSIARNRIKHLSISSWASQAHVPLSFSFLFISLIRSLYCLQEEPDEHGQGKWEGKQEGKSDKRITESKAQQKESTTLCINLADYTKEASAITFDRRYR